MSGRARSNSAREQRQPRVEREKGPWRAARASATYHSPPDLRARESECACEILCVPVIESECERETSAINSEATESYSG